MAGVPPRMHRVLHRTVRRERARCDGDCGGGWSNSRLWIRRARPGFASGRGHRSHASPTDFPGDAATGLLATGPEAEAQFEEFANEEPCPALDPDTGTCDLYAARPITCRTFGPPVRCGSDRVGICELCFDGADEDEIAACEVEVDPGGLEGALIGELETTTGTHGETIVAFALLARDA